jgi:hypothetical protein
MATADPRILIPEIEKFEGELRDVFVKASTAAEDSAQVQNALEDLVANVRDQASHALRTATTAHASASRAVADSRRARSDSERAQSAAWAAANACQAAVAEARAAQSRWQAETDHASDQLGKARRELAAAELELKRLLDIHAAAVAAERAAGAALSSCLARQYRDANGNLQGPSCSGEYAYLASAGAARAAAEEPLPGARDRVAHCQNVVRQWADRLQHCQMRVSQARGAVEAGVIASGKADQCRGDADDSARIAGEAESSAMLALHAANAATISAENAARAAGAADHETSSARATSIACGQAVDDAQAHASVARTRLDDSIEALRRFDSPGVRA